MNITTLIPAFKPQYLRQLLIALQSQTVKPTKIIISDDSPDQAFRAALIDGPYKDVAKELNIEAIEGPRKGGPANGWHLLKVWNESTPLVHFLMDDDIIYPEFYERHLAVHATGEFDCSVSRRWTATETGQPIGKLKMPEELAQHKDRLVALEADWLFASVIPDCNNWLGEHSNAVYNQSAIATYTEHNIAGVAISGLEDIGLFLAASLKKPVCFINEPLGFFRTSATQVSNQPMSHTFKLGVLAWIALGVAGRRLELLSREQVLQCYVKISILIKQRYVGVEDMMHFDALIHNLLAGDAHAEDAFIQSWHAFIPKI